MTETKPDRPQQKLLHRADCNSGSVEIDMRRGLVAVLGMTEGICSTTPDGREFFKSLVRECQEPCIPMPPIVQMIWDLYGPTTVHGGSPTHQGHIRAVCTFLSALEQVRRKGSHAASVKGK